jgi:radical SAM family protein
MRLTLIHPPLDDPTQPYHSLAYLAGQLLHSGFKDSAIRDINIEFVNYCLEESQINSFNAEIQNELCALSSKPKLGFINQEEYYALWSAPQLDPADIKRAVDGLRTREVFLDFPTYLKNAQLLADYFTSLGSLSYPSELINLKQRSRSRYSVYHLNDLLNFDLAARTCAPFTRFFEERLQFDQGFAHTDCFGFSIVYDHQLSHALYLAKLLKDRFPDKRVVLGGTSISQLYKYLQDKTQMRRFFKVCDAIVVGEGETAICEIADAGTNFAERRDLPNTITYDAARDTLHFPKSIYYENVNALARPVYGYPWHLYLSPAPGIGYAPTRGCYWNRCTFCDYGLNSDSPTSPWRERKVDRVIEDLQVICQQNGIKYIYFAVDVMAPSYLERLSDAIVESGLDFRWSAELRMEKIFSEERCRKMAKGGCVSISFGMESGNQRILDLIDKGTKIDYMAQTMKNFARADVAVQIMAFTDFPTETKQEEEDTFKFVEDNRDYWSTGGVGKFMLTGTAIIAKNPQKFGITLLETEDADVARTIGYRIDNKNETLLAEDGDVSFDDNRGAFPKVPDRPWAGATDTLHSMIYYDAYSRDFFKHNNLTTQTHGHRDLSDEVLMECTIVVPGKIAQTQFDMDAILANRGKLSKRTKELLLLSLEPTYERFTKWQAEVEPVNSLETSSYWIILDDQCARLGKGVFKIIQMSSQQGLRLGKILETVKPQLAAILLDNLRLLERRRLLQFEKA